MTNIRKLDWDSEFFGLKTGEYVSKDILPSMIEDDLLKAKKNEYKLIYIKTKTLFKKNILDDLQGQLLDIKVIYSLNSNLYKSNNGCSEVLLLEDNFNETDKNQLIHLGIESGIYSRFKKDKNIDNIHFRKLYSSWVLNSLNKKIVDKVFIIRKNELIVGFITLKVDDNQGQIGLLAVDENYRGNGYATLLLKKVITYCTNSNVYNLKVVTQQDNIGACSLYEKVGFNLIDKDYIYHFWL